MTDLSPNARALFAACAERMSHREEVERVSDGLTVRPADSELFRLRVMGPAAYVAVCPRDTPEGTVTELTPDITLYTVGPYSRGCMLEKDRAEH